MTRGDTQGGDREGVALGEGGRLGLRVMDLGDRLGDLGGLGRISLRTDVVNTVPFTKGCAAVASSRCVVLHDKGRGSRAQPKKN